MASAIREKIAQTSKSMIGWGYIYGATGWICTAARVEAQAKQYPAYAVKIRKYGLTRWLGKHCVDCAQNDKLSAKAAGITMPSGATSQWNAAIWAEKGTIDSLPDDNVGLFLYRQDSENPSIMQHTGVCVGDGHAVEAKGHAYGVIQSALAGAGWTHWGRLDESKAVGTAADAATTTTTTTEGGNTMSNLAGYICAVNGLKTGTTKLNVRATASDTGNKLGTVSAGEQVTCLNDDDVWAHVRTTAGLTGYCLSKYLKAVQAVSIGSDRLALLEARVAALEVTVNGASGADG